MNVITLCPLWKKTSIITIVKDTNKSNHLFLLEIIFYLCGNENIVILSSKIKMYFNSLDNMLITALSELHFAVV